MHLLQTATLLFSTFWMLTNAMAQDLPAINISITPHFEGIKVTSLNVHFGIQEPKATANGTLVSLSLSDELATTQQYNASDIQASDDSGKLSLSHSDDEDDRHYKVERATVGDVVLAFTARPKLQPGKLEFLHMGAENDEKALFGPGMGFIPTPTGKNYTISLDWDLSKAPNGTRAVWSFGEGASVTKTGPASFVGESFFAVGQMNSFPPLGTQSNFTTYWFDDPPPGCDLPGLATYAHEVFEHMRDFFRDPDDNYRVFARKFPANQSSGASAKVRSFMFPVSEGMDIKETKTILAHELVHNWPTAEDAANGSPAEWYVEGVADYYSAHILFRYGMHTAEQYLEQMNGFARAYYANPLINLTLDQMKDEKLQEDGNAISIPYQRGNMFLVRMDALIRSKTNGTRSIDNVVQAMLDRTRAHQGDTVDDLLDLMVKELGPEARTEYQDMHNGKTLTMPENSLGPCYAVEQVQIPHEECISTAVGLCNDSASTVTAYEWKRKVGTTGSGCLD